MSVEVKTRPEGVFWRTVYAERGGLALSLATHAAINYKNVTLHRKDLNGQGVFEIFVKDQNVANKLSKVLESDEFQALNLAFGGEDLAGFLALKPSWGKETQARVAAFFWKRRMDSAEIKMDLSSDRDEAAYELAHAEFLGARELYAKKIRGHATLDSKDFYNILYKLVDQHLKES